MAVLIQSIYDSENVDSRFCMTTLTGEFTRMLSHGPGIPISSDKQWCGRNIAVPSCWNLGKMQQLLKLWCSLRFGTRQSYPFGCGLAFRAHLSNEDVGSLPLT